MLRQYARQVALVGIRQHGDNELAPVLFPGRRPAKRQSPWPPGDAAGDPFIPVQVPGQFHCFLIRNHGDFGHQIQVQHVWFEAGAYALNLVGTGLGLLFLVYVG